VVLLTDDDPEVTRITDAHVRAGGYRTLLAFDGEAALQAIREQRPDAIVLDLMLPKRTGFDVLAELRQMPAPRPTCWCCRPGPGDVTRPSRSAPTITIKPFSPQGSSRAWGGCCVDRHRGVRGAAREAPRRDPHPSQPPRGGGQPARSRARPTRTPSGWRGGALRALEAFQALADANPDDFDSRVWLGRLVTRVGRRARRSTSCATSSPARRVRWTPAALGAALSRRARRRRLRRGAGRRAGAGRPTSSLKGRVLQHLGHPSEAYVALDAAPTLSVPATRTSASSASVPPHDRAPRPRQRRQEASEDIPEATIVDTDIDLHLDDTCACSAASNGRRGPASTTRRRRRRRWRSRGGGRPRRAVDLSSSLRLARADAGGEVEFAAGAPG
jgi:CheY-like chemotaxis protein